VRSRLLTAAVGSLASLLVSAAAYVYFDTLLLFLFLPLVPFLFRGLGDDGSAATEPPIRECPRCGYRTRSPEHDYCPRDGARLD
jgi:hypothetical protein